MPQAVFNEALMELKKDDAAPNQSDKSHHADGTPGGGNTGYGAGNQLSGYRQQIADASNDFILRVRRTGKRARDIYYRQSQRK